MATNDQPVAVFIHPPVSQEDPAQEVPQDEVEDESTPAEEVPQTPEDPEDEDEAVDEDED